MGTLHRSLGSEDKKSAFYGWPLRSCKRQTEAWWLRDKRLNTQADSSQIISYNRTLQLPAQEAQSQPWQESSPDWWGFGQWCPTFLYFTHQYFQLWYKHRPHNSKSITQMFPSVTPTSQAKLSIKTSNLEAVPILFFFFTCCAFPFPACLDSLPNGKWWCWFPCYGKLGIHSLCSPLGGLYFRASSSSTHMCSAASYWASGLDNWPESRSSSQGGW